MPFVVRLVLFIFIGVMLGLLMPARHSRVALITPADARVGEPLTPGSVAGVRRREMRRDYRRGMPWYVTPRVHVPGVYIGPPRPHYHHDYDERY